MADFLSGTPGTSFDSAQDAARAGAEGGNRPTSEAQAEFTAGLLQAALAVRKVEAIVALSWSGPQVNTYSVSLTLGERPETVEQLAGALALAAGSESCRVSRGEGKLLLELPKAQGDRKPLLADRIERLPVPGRWAACAGIATGGRAVWLDLADERFAHVIIGGTTGSGKTVLLRWLLYQLVRHNRPDDLRLLLLDPKRFELKQFEAVPHLLHPVTSNPLEVARVLGWVANELEVRAESGRSKPRLVIAVEEVADLTGANEQVGPLLARVAQIGRALGVHLLATTQQPGAKSLGDALVNFPARMLGRVASATLAYGAAGRKKTSADVLLGKGDFLLLAAGETTRLQAPWMEERMWAKLPKGRPGSLEAELPSLASFADLARDPRGGRGGRPFTADQYREMDEAVKNGARPGAIRRTFGIGAQRANRLVNGGGKQR